MPITVTDLRIARLKRDEVMSSLMTTPVQRAQAHADFFALIRAAYNSLPVREIAAGAGLSRQRVHQIANPRRQPDPTEVRLPETDV